MNLVRFNGSSYSIYIPAVKEFKDNGSFVTTALSNTTNSFGRDLSKKLFERIFIKGTSYDFLITPLVDYEIFEQISDCTECDLIGIKYYSGTAFKTIVKVLGEKEFIVNEKLQVRTRIPNQYKEEYYEYYDNDILMYRGVKHHDKQQKDIKYEGDCNTQIQLHDNCRFTKYKFVTVKKLSLGIEMGI